MKSSHVLIYLRREQAELIAEALAFTADELHDRWETISGLEKLQELKTMRALLQQSLDKEVGEPN